MSRRLVGGGVVGDFLARRGQALQVPVGQLAHRQRPVLQGLNQQFIHQRLLAVVVVEALEQLHDRAGLHRGVFLLFRQVVVQPGQVPLFAADPVAQGEDGDIADVGVLGVFQGGHQPRQVVQPGHAGDGHAVLPHHIAGDHLVQTLAHVACGQLGGQLANLLEALRLDGVQLPHLVGQLVEALDLVAGDRVPGDQRRPGRRVHGVGRVAGVHGDAALDHQDAHVHRGVVDKQLLGAFVNELRAGLVPAEAGDQHLTVGVLQCQHPRLIAAADAD